MEIHRIINETTNWWFLKRVQFTRGLLISAPLVLIVNLMFTPLHSILNANELMFNVVLISIVYLAYISVANILYTLGSIIDLLFNKTESQEFKDRAFACIYWLFVGIIPLLTTSYLKIISIMVSDLPE